jgi:hypothetical protein
VLVPPESDPDRFAEGLAGLDRVVVLLDDDTVEPAHRTHPCARSWAIE